MAYSACHGFGARADNIDVATPHDLYTALDDEFQFDHDPCPLGGAAATSDVGDGLAPSIAWGERNFVNPPVAECARWLERAASEAEQRPALSVCLVPLRPNTRYWSRWVWPRAHEVRVFERRLSFEGYRGQRAPMALCLVVYAPAKQRRGLVKRVQRGRYGMYRVKL